MMQSQKGAITQSSVGDGRIMEILAQANVQQEEKFVDQGESMSSKTVAPSGNIQSMQGTTQAPPHLANVVKSIISPGSVSDIKNASPTKVQIIYKPQDGKESTQEEFEELTRNLLVKPDGQTGPFMRHKVQNQPGLSSQMMRITHPGHQQSVVVQGQKGAVQREVFVQQGTEVQQSRTVQMGQQSAAVSQQSQVVPRANQHWLSYHQQQHLLEQQRMQTGQMQRQVQNQQHPESQQQEEHQEQQQLMQNEQQAQFQNHQAQQQQSNNNHNTSVNSTADQTATQYVNSQGELVHLSQTGKQVLLQSQHTTSGAVRNLNQYTQSAGQTVYNKSVQVSQLGSQVVCIMSQNQQGQEGKPYEMSHGPLTGQTVEGVQDRPVAKYLGNVPYNTMTSEQYQQNVQGQTVFTGRGRKKRRPPTKKKQQQMANTVENVTLHQLARPTNTTAATHQGTFQQQQQTVLTLGSHVAVNAQVHSQTGYPQVTATAVNTQSNNCTTVGGQASYQSTRSGLNQLKTAYNQGTPKPHQLVHPIQAGNKNIAAQMHEGAVSTMASIAVRQIKDAVVSAGRPQMGHHHRDQITAALISMYFCGHHTVLASPDEDCPPEAPIRPLHAMQGQQQHVVNAQQSPVPQTSRQTIVCLTTGQDVTENLKSLAPGTAVVVRSADNAALQAVWNGTSITLKSNLTMQGVVFN